MTSSTGTDGYNAGDGGSFSLHSDVPLTIYVQALQQGMGDIELQIDPLGDGHWTTVNTVRFTALDTNVGSPSGVSVTPAGYLAVNEDPLGVGSSIFTTSAQPGVVTFGLPAHLVLTGNGVAVIQNDQIDIWDFENTSADPANPIWVLVPRKPQEQGTMVYNSPTDPSDPASATYVQTVNGTQYTFAAPDPDDNLSSSPNDFGLLTSTIDPYGKETDYYYNGSGQLTSEIWTVGPEHIYSDGLDHPSQEQVAYTYSGSNVSETVTLGYEEDGAWNAPQPVSSATILCNYKGQPDLIETFNAANAVTGATYLRYYTTTDAGTGGVAGDVQYVLGPDSLARLMAADNFTFSQSDLLSELYAANVATYADNAVTYYGGGSSFDLMTSRVASNAAQGSGLDTYNYALSTDPTESFNFPDGLNTWSVEEQETRADNSQVTTFSNFDGDAMLTDMSDGSGDAQHWVTWNRYDQYANVVLAAQPSAMSAESDGSRYDMSLPDLIGFAPAVSSNITDGTSDYLNSSAGLIDVSVYCAATGDDPGQPGLAGWLEASGVQQGSNTTPDWQSSVDYVAQTTGTGPNAVTVYETSHSTQYQQAYASATPPTPSTTVAGPETTTYSYTYYGVAVATQTTTLPVVSTDEGGTGTPSSSTDVYNTLGQVVWSQDASGSISYTAYDPATGAVDEQIQDVNFSQNTDTQFQTDLTALENLHLGWDFATTAKNLITKYVVDSQGRTIWQQDPDGDVTCTVYDDAVRTVTDGDGTAMILNEVRTYPGWTFGRKHGRDHRRGASLLRGRLQRRRLHAIAHLLLAEPGRHHGRFQRHDLPRPGRHRAVARRHDRVAFALDRERPGSGLRGGRLHQGAGRRLHRHSIAVDRRRRGL